MIAFVTGKGCSGMEYKAIFIPIEPSSIRFSLRCYLLNAYFRVGSHHHLAFAPILMPWERRFMDISCSILLKLSSALNFSSKILLNTMLAREGAPFFDDWGNNSQPFGLWREGTDPRGEDG